MDWILSLNWNWFFLRLSALLIVSSFIGYIATRSLQIFENAWKSKSKKRVGSRVHLLSLL